jgi:glycosyltransferase involved in cell wall biosynthesis
VPREELPAAYAGGDVTLFPVRWAEPFGLVPLEAMAVGRPVVASGRGGSGEILRDGANCLLVDPDQGPAALAARIRELADDPALRARLREGGLRTVAEIVAERFDDTVLGIVEDRVAARRHGAAAG